MSQLTVWLAIAGGLVLAGVIAHGAWTARRRSHQVATEAVSPQEEHELFPISGFEISGFQITDDENLEPSFLPLPEHKPGLDGLIDAITHVRLASHEPVSGKVALNAMPKTRRVGTKSFLIEGLHAQSQTWERPKRHHQYSAFQAGIQLANRSGALNEIEFSEFIQKATSFADSIDADCDFPDMREVISRARELDHFAQAHDAQLSFTLKARNVSWSPGFIKQVAEDLGFVMGAMPGRLVLPNSVPTLPPLLTLHFDTAAALAEDPEQSALRVCKLSLDAPQVDRHEQAFVRMREAAIKLCARMDGLLCDEAGARIPPEALDAIGADLEHLYDTLDERDLSAGSPQARRLFS